MYKLMRVTQIPAKMAEVARRRETFSYALADMASQGEDVQVGIVVVLLMYNCRNGNIL